LTAGIVHDLNDLLTVITGFSAILLRRPNLGKEAEKKRAAP
jgi:hypothetical protein